jgi:hypothetical protein
MAYPFTNFPTLDEFIEHVKSRYGAELITLEGKITGPRGATEINSLFIKPKKFVIIPDIKPKEPLHPNTLRSLCNQLGIPLKDFGLPLD